MTENRRDELLLEISSKLDTACAQMMEHHTTLYGNGRPGLTARFQTVETHQVECPARLRALKDNKMFTVAVVMCAISFASFVYVILEKV